ncbi:MAG TPA: HNH endonuclease [Chloroflexia bacterium]
MSSKQIRNPNSQFPNPPRLSRVAETDSTFTRQGRLWVGKCLICNGPIAFDAVTGEGATLEHILARSRGGTDDPHNLGIAHGSCNGEKGRRWDKKRSRTPEEYEALVQRFRERRLQRWRDAQ